jgi:hypothetical protein
LLKKKGKIVGRYKNDQTALMKWHKITFWGRGTRRSDEYSSAYFAVPNLTMEVKLSFVT